MNDKMCHMASSAIDAPEDFVFTHLADPVRLGRWALGCMDVTPTDDPRIFRGRSLFDGRDVFVEIETHRSLGLIDYHIGNKEVRAPRIFIRVAPGSLCGLSNTQCVVSMAAWRTADMDADRWRQLCRTHEVEILLIKSQIETRFGDEGSKTE